MIIKLFNEKNEVVKTVGRVKAFLCHSFGDLLVTFEDWSETTIKKSEYAFFDVQEY